MIFESWDFTQAVKNAAKEHGADIRNDQSVTLTKLFTPENGASTHTSLLMNTLYTDVELTTTLEKGFYGHPNIGAAVFNCVRDSFLDVHNSVFMEALVQDLNALPQEACAPLSVWQPVWRYRCQRDAQPGGCFAVPQRSCHQRRVWRTRKLSIGAGMMPYFKTPVDPAKGAKGTLRPSSAKFMQQTKEALLYYDKFGLVDKVTSLLLLGTHELAVTSEIYARGEKQYQHFHLVLLVAAIGAYRFLNGTLLDPVTNKELHGALVWKIAPAGSEFQSVLLSELGLSGEEKKLDQMLRFCVMVTQFMRERYNHTDDDLRHYREVIATSGMPAKGIINHYVPLTQEQLNGNYRERFSSAGKFCRFFIQFYFDVALSGYDWTKYHVHKQNKDGVEEVNEGCKDGNRANSFGLRMTDLLNVKLADQLVEQDLGDDTLGKFMLRDLFAYQTVDEKRPMTTDFPQITMPVCSGINARISLEINSTTVWQMFMKCYIVPQNKESERVCPIL